MIAAFCACPTFDGAPRLMLRREKKGTGTAHSGFVRGYLKLGAEPVPVFSLLFSL